MLKLFRNWFLCSIPIQIAAVQFVVNGDFATGDFTGWTVENESGSGGTWFVYSGTLTPITDAPVPAPPYGMYAAVTDEIDPTLTVLYQDIFLPAGKKAELSYTYFIDNLYEDYVTPPTLDFTITTGNQQARIDIMSPSSEPFSVAFGDVLMNLLQTPPGSPLFVGYTQTSVDLSAFAGETIRLRFAQVDSLDYFYFGVDGVSIFIPIPLAGLTGNNASLANYLNDSAPVSTANEFAYLSGEALSQALMSAAPTRNAFATYASQNAFLAASQALSDHTRGKRFHHRPKGQTQVASLALAEEELLADASDAMLRGRGKAPLPRDPYTIWLTPFGEYAREKKQNQTPAFSMGLGGALIAFEYCGEEANLIGVGGAYAFTHSHEEGGAGRANLNQGYLTAYGTVARDNWYLDLALWGGYYSANNRRRISFPGVDETARSRIQGWQIAPHIEAGYCGFKWKKCHADWFNSDAFVMGDFVVNSEGSFKERGANEFDMGQKKRSCSFFRGETGLRFYEVLECNWGSLVLKEKGSYAYQKAFQTGIITAYLLGSPGSFTVATLTGAQNLGVAEFSTLFIPTGSKAPYVDIRYQGEFGSRYQSHQGMVEMGKDF